MCNKEVHLLVIRTKCCQNARCNNKKIIDAQQAKLRNNYKNTKLNLPRGAFVGDKNLSIIKMHGTTTKSILHNYSRN